MNFVNLYFLSFTLHYLTIWLYMFVVFYQGIIILICSLKDRSILNSLKNLSLTILIGIIIGIESGFY